MEWGDKDTKFGFKWECDEVTGYVREAWYQCRGEECIALKRKITDGHKMQLDEMTEYRAQIPFDSFNLRQDYGNSDFDTRHNFTTFLDWQVPGNSHLKWLTSGWEVSTLITLHSC